MCALPGVLCRVRLIAFLQLHTSPSGLSAFHIVGIFSSYFYIFIIFQLFLFAPSAPVVGATSCSCHSHEAFVSLILTLPVLCCPGTNA